MHVLPYGVSRRTLFDAERQSVVVKWSYNFVYKISKVQMSIPGLVILRCFHGFSHSLQVNARHIPPPLIDHPTALPHRFNSVALVRERTIPTERPPPLGEVSANLCG